MDVRTMHRVMEVVNNLTSGVYSISGASDAINDIIRSEDDAERHEDILSLVNNSILSLQRVYANLDDIKV